MTTRPTLQSLVAHAGAAHVPSSWPTWHGPDVLCGESPSDVAHELAHYIVAPPSRRRIKWHGLGSPGTDDGPLRTSLNYAIAEESLASLLGILIERECGASDHRDTWEDHSWWDNRRNAITALRRLRIHGLIERGARGWRWSRRLRGNRREMQSR